MSTTTIRIEDELRARLTAAAKLADKSPHAFILEAIAQRVDQVELEAEFDRLAEERWSRLRDTGRTMPWAEAKAYLQARARGDDVQRPSLSDPRP